MKKDYFYYPEAIDWMWDYCTPLGKYESLDGEKYDLGVYISKEEVVGAIVCSNRPGDYLSPTLDSLKNPRFLEDVYKETYKRYLNMRRHA